MKFINKGNPIKVRIGSLSDYKWITIHTNETADIPEQIGLANGLEKVEIKVTEGKIGEIKVETKQEEKETTEKEVEGMHDFISELRKINGIGKKTVQDIVKVFSTKKKLEEAINSGQKLPFRDDIEAILRRKYGGK